MVPNVDNGDRVSFNAVTTTSPVFKLRGGYYDLAADTPQWGTATLRVQRLLPGGSNWEDRGAGLSADGSEILHLGPGDYRLSASGGGNDPISVTLYRIPA